MSYDGPTSNKWRMDDIADRLRMFLQGRVYLRTNLAAEGTTCTIGQDGATRGGGCDIPCQFFNGWSTPINAVLEQRTAEGADSLATPENVSISAVPGFHEANYGLQVTLDTGPVAAFTTAKSARIGLRTHPVTGTTSPPAIVSQGYIDQIFSAEFPTVGPQNFPCVCVDFADIGTDPDLGGNAYDAEHYVFTCTWIREIERDQNIDNLLMQDAKIFLQMIDDDNYIGGATDMSTPLPPQFEPDAELREGIRLEKNLDLIHFGVDCVRGELRNKFS